MKFPNNFVLREFPESWLWIVYFNTWEISHNMEVATPRSSQPRKSFRCDVKKVTLLMPDYCVNRTWFLPSREYQWREMKTISKSYDLASDYFVIPKPRSSGMCTVH